MKEKTLWRGRKSILMIEDNINNLNLLVELLSSKPLDLHIAKSGEDALIQLQYFSPDLILLDIMMDGMDGFETCQRILARKETKNIPIIFISALSDQETKMRGFKAGCRDFVSKPLDVEEVFHRIKVHLMLEDLTQELKLNNIQLKEENWRRLLAEQELEAINKNLEHLVLERTKALQEALETVNTLKKELEQENTYLKEEIETQFVDGEIICKSQAFKNIMSHLHKVSDTDTTVLILGETGTGKEVIARALHRNSRRKTKPLVKVNCAALPENLIESELFGHERGAFTGALQRKLGRFEIAHKGTIFLDEIGDLPLSLQAKLLRVLQEGEFERIGNPQTISVDVRVIAATNRNLDLAVSEGTFRKDLFYRLNVFPLNLPPLRERIEDIPLLLEYFLKKFQVKIGRKIISVDKEVPVSFCSYSWPGNIREMENIVERLIITSENGRLCLNGWDPTDSSNPTKISSGSIPNSLEELERAHIIRTLKKTNWRVSGAKGAAVLLGLKGPTLVSKMRKMGIERDID